MHGVVFFVRQGRDCVSDVMVCIFNTFPGRLYFQTWSTESSLSHEGEFKLDEHVLGVETLFGVFLLRTPSKGMFRQEKDMFRCKTCPCVFSPTTVY